MKSSGVIFTAKKRQPLRFLLMVFVTALSLVFFTFQKSNGSSYHKAIAASPQNAVIIQHLQFIPAQITVSPGTTVVWTNQENNIPHTVTSDSGLWDSGTLQPRQSFSHTFSTPGTFSYHCNIHPFMHGTIVVTGTTSEVTPTPLPTSMPVVTPTPTIQPPSTRVVTPTPLPVPVTSQPSPIVSSPTPTPIAPVAQIPLGISATQSQSQSQSAIFLNTPLSLCTNTQNCPSSTMSIQQSQAQSQSIIISSPR